MSHDSRSMTPEDFCIWLEGGRELGAFHTGDVTDVRRAFIETRLKAVAIAAPQAGRADSPCARFVRDFQGTVSMSVDWTQPHPLTFLLSRLQGLFTTSRRGNDDAPAALAGLRP